MIAEICPSKSSRLRSGRRSHRILVGVLLAGAASLAAAVTHAQVRGTIVGPGETAFPIAIAPLGGSGGEPCGKRFGDTLSRDLDISGLFRVLDPGVAGGGGEAEVDFASWGASGARLLVTGRCDVVGDDTILEARLFDIAERRQLGGKRYQGGRREVRRMAHRFGDEVMRLLTGERGPFDTRIAFVSTRAGRAKELYVTGFDGEEVRQLTSNGTINLSPSWSPDGRELLLTSYKDGRPKLYELDLSSGRFSLLLSGPGLTNGGRFSPDGGRIAASREESKGNSEIVVLDRDGEVRRVVAAHDGIDVSPSWSPDGRQIAFCSARGGAPQIYVADADGGSARRVSFGGSYNTSPAWSPRGARIAYTGRVGGRFQIFVSDAAGGEARQITSSDGDNVDPSWSPDGRYLIFSSTRGGGRGQLWVVDERGLRQRQLIRGPGGDSSPAWSSWLE